MKRPVLAGYPFDGLREGLTAALVRHAPGFQFGLASPERLDLRLGVALATEGERRPDAGHRGPPGAATR